VLLRCIVLHVAAMLALDIWVMPKKKKKMISFYELFDFDVFGGGRTLNEHKRTQTDEQNSTRLGLIKTQTIFHHQ
jgi:hypothetical protein